MEPGTDPRAPSQIRLSPDGRHVAIRNRDSKSAPLRRWRTTGGGYYRDDQVEGWYPLVNIPSEDCGHIAYALHCAVASSTLATSELADFDRLIKFFEAQQRAMS